MTCPHLREEHHALVSDFIIAQRAPLKIQPVSPALKRSGFHNTPGIWLHLPLGDTSVVSEAGVRLHTPERHLWPAGTQRHCPIHTDSDQTLPWGASSLPQMVSDLITSLIFCQLEWGECVTWEWLATSVCLHMV